MFNLPCNLDSSPIVSSAGTQKIFCAYPKFCVKQYLDKVKLSTKDREGYIGHENLWVFFYSSGEPRSKKSLMVPWPALASQTSAHFVPCLGSG